MPREHNVSQRENIQNKTEYSDYFNSVHTAAQPGKEKRCNKYKPKRQMKTGE